MIGVIAHSTARQLVRSKTFVSLIIIYVIAVLLSRVVGWISATDGNIVTADLVFSLQSVIGVLVAVATGTALVQTEIQQRTLYTILSRPLSRWHFVAGKFIGLCLGLCAGQLIMLLIGILYIWVTLLINGFGFPIEYVFYFFLAGLMIMVEVIIMAAVSMMFTLVSSPLLAAVLSLAVYMLGHAVATLPQLMNHLEGAQQWVAAVFASLVPNLGYFTYRNLAVHGYPPDYGQLGISVVYAALWIVLLLSITVMVFKRRQL